MTSLAATSELSIHSFEAVFKMQNEVEAKPMDMNLNEIQPYINEEIANEEHEEQENVPPADGGKGAWLFLAGCFVFEALVWGELSPFSHSQISLTSLNEGFPFAFGVFESYYSTNPPLAEHASGIAVIGTSATGCMYFFAPFTLHALEHWPSMRKRSSVLGLVVSVSALVAASFATQVWHLVLSQGVMYAVGGTMLYAPTTFYLEDWFVKKRGLAYGVMWSGVGSS